MKRIAAALLVSAVTAGAVAAQQPAPRDHAMLSISQARQTALARVPKNEGVKSEKLKTRAGILVYEFDIETPGAGHREIRIDAHTGAIVADHQEDDLIGETAEKAGKKAEKAGDKIAKTAEKAERKIDKTADKVFGKDEIAKANVRISEARAREIALRQVPNGKIKDSDLESENGILVWEIEVDTPGKGHEEILVDARTGVVLLQKHKS